MDKKELCKKVAKEILPKLDEVSDIINESDVDRASWITVTADGYINFALCGYEFTRSNRNGKLTIKYEEEL